MLVNTSIKAPLGLALDGAADVLYWYDQRLQKIDALELSTMQNRLVVANVSDCVGVAVHGDYIYWAER